VFVGERKNKKGLNPEKKKYKKFTKQSGNSEMIMANVCQ
jgi:hypothetical protein